ncbi:hypothetical protein PIB30_093974 [Stylosanthes scabra]|uniref:PB1-like domain-containing protein n=1 Tax=Stylosanthes scabra TaxID=79078 RepID=A0ABU6QVZ3_9FABA|nr:hypothetical protein [Stylosanthes scabra]
MYELDIDHLNMRDMVTLLEDIGYKSHKALHWFDVIAPEFETGLNELDGDQGIRELIDWLRTNKEPEFHIYSKANQEKPTSISTTNPFPRNPCTSKCFNPTEIQHFDN